MKTTEEIVWLPLTAHNRQLGFWGKFELAVLWKFHGELITFGHQTQPAFMREPLPASQKNIPINKRFMTETRSLAIDIFKLVPDNSTCFINAPSIYDNSQVLKLLQQSDETDWQLALTPDNKRRLIEVITLEKIEGKFELTYIKMDDLLVTAYDGFCSVMISSKIKFPEWFVKKYNDRLMFEQT